MNKQRIYRCREGYFSLRRPMNWKVHETSESVLFIDPSKRGGVLQVTPFLVPGNTSVESEALHTDWMDHLRGLGLSPGDRHPSSVKFPDAEAMYLGGTSGRPWIHDGIAWRMWLLKRQRLVLLVAYGSDPSRTPVDYPRVSRIIRSIRLVPYAGPTPGEFEKLVLQRLRARFPEREGTVEGDLTLRFGEKEVINLDHLYRRCQIDPEHMEQYIDYFLNVMLAEDPEPPEVKTWEEMKPRVRPMIVAGEPGPRPRSPLRPPRGLIAHRWLGHLWVAYAIDMPTRILFVSKSLLKTWKIRASTVRKTALGNFFTLNDELHLKAYPDEFLHIVQVRHDDALDSTRLLLPDLVERLKHECGPRILAGIPCRDMLLLTADKGKRTRDYFRRRLEFEFRRREYPLCPDLFLLDGRGVRMLSAGR